MHDTRIRQCEEAGAVAATSQEEVLARAEEFAAAVKMLEAKVATLLPFDNEPSLSSGKPAAVCMYTYIYTYICIGLTREVCGGSEDARGKSSNIASI